MQTNGSQPCSRKKFTKLTIDENPVNTVEWVSGLVTQQNSRDDRPQSFRHITGTDEGTFFPWQSVRCDTNQNNATHSLVDKEHHIWMETDRAKCNTENEAQNRKKHSLYPLKIWSTWGHLIVQSSSYCDTRTTAYLSMGHRGLSWTSPIRRPCRASFMDIKQHKAQPANHRCWRISVDRAVNLADSKALQG